MSMKISTN